MSNPEPDWLTLPQHTVDAEYRWHRPGRDWLIGLPRMTRCMYCWERIWPWQPTRWVKDYGQRHAGCDR